MGTEEVIQFKEIRLKVRGRCFVGWNESNGITTTTYTNEESYIDQPFIMCGNDCASDSRTELQPGDYSFPFSTVLPTEIPTSFEYILGHIRYWVKGTIESPSAWKPNVFTKKFFTVICPIDFNSLPEEDVNVTASVSDQKSKTLCCWPCKDGPVEADATINKKYFVAGETIECNYNVENHCNRPMKGVCARIDQRITLISTKTN